MVVIKFRADKFYIIISH